MFRPVGGSGACRRHGPSFVGLVLVPLAVFCALDAAHAAAPHSAAASGTVTTVEAKTRRLAGRLNEAYGPEQRAQELYLDGMEKLEAGHRDWALRTFEDLIARYPETSAATLARAKVGALRHGATEQSAALPAGKAEAPATRPHAELPPAIGRSPAWEQELRRNAAIQAKLRVEAGDRVFFAAGSAELGGKARRALAAQAQWLNLWHEFEAAIEGHADESGTEEENLQLSKLRAEAVRRRLVEEGVDAGRLAIVALGRTQPIATCKSRVCSAQNRRVVTLVFASGTRERLGMSATVRPDPAVELRAPASGRVKSLEIPTAGPVDVVR